MLQTSKLCFLFIGGIFAFLCTSCGPDGTANFEGTLSDSCYAKQFPFDANFFALTASSSAVFIRMEDEVRDRTYADGLYLLIDESLDGTQSTDSSTGAVVTLSCPKRSELAGQTLAVGPNQCVQAYFRFSYSCTRDFYNAQIRGEVAFDSFGTADGDVVAGTLSGQLVDIKESTLYGAEGVIEEPMGDVSGTFSFEVASSSSRQAYSTPPGHPVLFP